LTTQERVQSVIDYGFTERQARFLVLVMRHAGMCVKRQYAAFAGIANGGEKCNAFFDKLVNRGYATATDCIHNRAQLYHVHHKPLYHAIGEPDSRYRRAVPARSAAERLMRLDAALVRPNLEWLTTRAEKDAYLRTRITSEVAGHPDNPSDQDVPDGASSPPGTFPIGIDTNGEVLLLYLATTPWTDDFRTFVIAHIPVLCLTPAWTLRLVFPQSLRRVVAAYQTVVEEELKSPLDSGMINDLKRYFFHRRRGTDLNAIPDSLRAFLMGCGRTFAGPRFRHLYSRWLAHDEAVLTPVSPVIRQALTSGRAQVDYMVLPHTYDHLVPLVNRRNEARRGRRLRDERGARSPHIINPSLNPAP
jgi:hypothetical protein